MTVSGQLAATEFIAFIKRLLHNMPRTVFLIVDGHPAHKAKTVKQFVESMRNSFRIFVFPCTPLNSPLTSEFEPT